MRVVAFSFFICLFTLSAFAEVDCKRMEKEVVELAKQLKIIL
jgi:hypothetical protein